MYKEDNPIKAPQPSLTLEQVLLLPFLLRLGPSGISSLRFHRNTFVSLWACLWQEVLKDRKGGVNLTADGDITKRSINGNQREIRVYLKLLNKSELQSMRQLISSASASQDRKNLREAFRLSGEAEYSVRLDFTRGYRHLAKSLFFFQEKNPKINQKCTQSLKLSLAALKRKLVLPTALQKMSI